eukprot:scaffold77075_cov30-Tisochrysis_lutea.AAC.1
MPLPYLGYIFYSGPPPSPAHTHLRALEHTRPPRGREGEGLNTKYVPLFSALVAPGLSLPLGVEY